MHLQKFKVCDRCFSVGITDVDCICVYDANNTNMVELEFEVCDCCNNLLSDGSPADTPFNNEQLKYKL